MIAWLGMYDLPHVQAANDRLWQGIRHHLGYGPDALTRRGDPWDIWQSDDLLLAQTCGLPFRARLWDRVQLVGTPDYGLPGCAPGQYFSYVIKRKNDTRNLAGLAQGIMAYNESLSQSGWAAPIAYLQARGLYPAQLLHTGSHVGSISAVLSGKADFAGIDALTLLMWASEDMDAMAFLKTEAKTDPSPALPFITAKGRDPAPIAAALRAAIAEMSDEDRVLLHLQGLVDISADAYRALPLPPAP